MLNVSTHYKHVYYFLNAYAPRVFVMVVDCRDRICISRGKLKVGRKVWEGVLASYTVNLRID